MSGDRSPRLRRIIAHLGFACSLGSFACWIGYGKSAMRAIRTVALHLPHSHDWATIAGFCSLGNLLLGVAAIVLGVIARAGDGEAAAINRLANLGIVAGLLAILLGGLLV